MVGVGGFAPPSTPPVALKPLSSKYQIHRPNLSFFQLPNYNTQLLSGRSRFRISAQKKGSGLSGRIEQENEADFEDEDFDDVGGDGTSVEDKLLEEIEQSEKSQLENESQEAKPNIELNKDLKASEVTCSEIRVRINNLPKKKNVRRDLLAAFQGVKGIVNISPVVFGNNNKKKTRHPVCRGFGYVDFKSLEHANRFIQMFSDRTVAFGKIKRQIKCEILNSDDAASKAQHGISSSSETEFEEFDDEDVTDDIKLLEISGNGENDDIEHAEMEKKSLRFMASEDEGYQDPDTEENDEEELLVDENAAQNIDLVRASNQEDTNGTELNMKPSASALSIHNEKKTPKPKISIQALAKMLKIRDPAKLIEFISRSRAAKDKEALTDNIEEDLLQFVGKEGFDDSIDGKEAADEIKKTLSEKYDIKPKPKANKTPNLNIRGSSKKLEGQDRAKLEDIFNKY